MPALIAPALLLAVTLLGATATGCFDSDDLGAADGVATDTTGVTTVEPTDEEGDGDDMWDPDTGAGDTTCRGAIECLVTCQIQLSQNPEPEPDLSCFTECDPGLTTEEAYALLKLGECIALQCAETGQCADPDNPVDTDGPTDMDCLNCIVAGALDPQPPGCVEEAAACG